MYDSEEPKRTSLDLKINPLWQMIISLVLMYAIARLLPIASALIDYKWFASVFLLVVGTFFITAGEISFYWVKTTLNPEKPENASSLVTSGIYHKTRNPMYVGLVFLLLAWAAWLMSFFSVIVVVFFQQYMTRFQIIPEERALTNLFPEECRNYCKKVRRWL